MLIAVEDNAFRVVRHGGQDFHLVPGVREAPRHIGKAILRGPRLRGIELSQEENAHFYEAERSRLESSRPVRRRPAIAWAASPLPSGAPSLPEPSAECAFNSRANRLGRHGWDQRVPPQFQGAQSTLSRRAG